ncbi:MAG: aldo/keto reductase [Mangrovibacterium sp.]
MERRNFLKAFGAGSALAGAALTGCKPQNTVSAEGGMLGEVPTDKMTYRTNTSTGDQVSLLGYGCMRWPLRKKAYGSGEEVDQEAVNQLVDYAMEHGVNYFDTAPVYVRGWSEEATGKALARHPRNKYFVATKLSNFQVDAARPFESGKEMYQKSMRDLQVDYLDYYLLHGMGMGGMDAFNERMLNNGLLDYMVAERKAGRIRNLGWSFHGDVKVFDYLLALHDAREYHWDFVMIQLNYVDWLHATGRNVNAQYLYGELEKRNISVIVMEPLLGGRLSRLGSEAYHLLSQLRPDESAASWAFRYAGSPKNILTVLSGMVYLEHLQENVRTYSPLNPISEHEYAVLEKVTDIMLNSDYVQCTECQYCMPCPYGLDIPAIFGHYNRVISAGDLLKNSKDEQHRKSRRAFLVGYDRSVPKLRQANHCIGCGLCKSHCPQRIDIPTELRKIDAYVEKLKTGGEF